MNPLFLLHDRFGDRLAPLSSPESVTGGFSDAIVLKVACQTGIYALRAWPEHTNPRRVLALHRLLHHVAARGVPVAAPLADRNAETLFPHDGRWWQVEPWLPGRADFHDSPTDTRLAAAMQMLAVFHEAAATFDATPDEAEWLGGSPTGPAPAARDRLEILNRLLHGEAASIRNAVATAEGDFADLSRRTLAAFDRASTRVAAELRFALSAPVPLIPCLRDVWHDHVLFTGDEVTGLIDPAACRRDAVATDLSRLLGSFLGDDPPRWDAAIAAYARRRPLADAEAALIPTLDRSGVLLSAMTWLRRRYLFDQPCETPPVIARLREAVVRLEAMP